MNYPGLFKNYYPFFQVFSGGSLNGIFSPNIYITAFAVTATISGGLAKDFIFEISFLTIPLTASSADFKAGIASAKASSAVFLIFAAYPAATLVLSSST
jgi:hypothetical protein